MKISVIIPTFNAARDIPETLARLFQSDHQDYEVIVVDDGSTDDTVKLVQGYPVKLLCMPSNQGAAAARNKGSEVAEGEVLFFIDADVWVETDTLTVLKQCFDDPHQPIAVVGSYRPEQPVSSFFSSFQNFYTFYNHDRCLAVESGLICWFWTACGAIKRNIFKEMDGFREIYSGASAEDMDLGYRLADRGYPILLNKKLEVTHAHNHSLTSILRNNYKKAAAWGELYLRKNPKGQYKHGFTSGRNFVTVLLVALSCLSLIGLVVSPWFLIGLSFALFFFILVNRSFFRFVYNSTNAVFLVKAVLFHFLANFFIGLGGVVALARKHVGQEGEKG